MAGETERFVANAKLHPVVLLPDGSQQAPLGSGYITALIGSGGMSNVYKIWNPQMETFRAVKLMKPDLSAESRQRFQTEIKIMAALSHPNIVKIHSVGEWNGLAFIEMEFIDGFTLAEIIAQRGALPVPVCSALGLLVAKTLVYAHNLDYVLFGKSYRGIIHRDLKPSNIMIGKDGTVRLMDFGIARPVETSLLTMDGAVMGTMQYLAPEQVSGKNVGIAADLYALGAVLYECLTGRKAFPQENLSQLMAAKTGNIFVPLRFFRTKVPAGLKKTVGTCMMSDAKKRFPSAAAALEKIGRCHAAVTRDTAEEVVSAFLRTLPEAKTVLTVRKPAPRAALAWGAAALLVLVSIPASLSHRTRQAERPQSPQTSRDAAVRPRPAPAAQRKNTAPITARPATTTPATPPPVKASYLDEMKAKYGIADPLELCAKEANAGNFQSVLLLFNDLPAPVANSGAARLLRLRALYGLGKTADAAEVFRGQPIDDGEYYLTNAKYLCDRGDAAQALAVLEKSIAIKARFLDAETVRREYQYCRALCRSLLFDADPSGENRNTALDSWFEVKNSLRNFPDHAYYRKAVSEMQRIGGRYAQGKG